MKKKNFSLILIFLISLIYLLGDDIKKIIINLEAINKPDQKFRICNSLQDKVNKIGFDLKNNLSLSVLDDRGLIIADINGEIPRIPASNQKLISSAFAISILNPNTRLFTSIYKSRRNVYNIVGSGDPDFDIYKVKLLASKITEDSLRYKSKSININLYDVSYDNWWPTSWTSFDRKQEYGAPITKLPLNSNSSFDSLKNPVDTFKYKLASYLPSNINSNIKVINTSFNNYRSKSILKLKSAPIYSLLSLANSESHNFTSEILFRAALDEWSFEANPNKLIKWLKRNNISIKGLEFIDASGLSRSNRVTTRTLSELLYKMSFHRYSNYYLSSFSIMGVRGTLSSNIYNPILNYKFYGKSGTLNNVKSITGIMKKSDRLLYVSAILNNKENSLLILDKILTTIYLNDGC